MDLQQEIKQRRKALKLSQVDLAEMSGVSISTVKDIERGKGNPSYATIKKIVDILGMEFQLKIRTTF